MWAPDGRNASYGSFSKDAAKVLKPAVQSTPKPVSEHTVIGTGVGRIDARGIVTGKAGYAMDVQVPGALPTLVARPPTINGTVRSVNNAATVGGMAGVVAVTPIPTGVAVSAGTFHEASRARDALQVSWGSGPVDGMSEPQSPSGYTGRDAGGAGELAVPAAAAAVANAYAKATGTTPRRFPINF